MSSAVLSRLRIAVTDPVEIERLISLHSGLAHHYERLANQYDDLKLRGAVAAHRKEAHRLRYALDNGPSYLSAVINLGNQHLDGSNDETT